MTGHLHVLRLQARRRPRMVRTVGLLVLLVGLVVTLAAGTAVAQPEPVPGPEPTPQPALPEPIPSPPTEPPAPPDPAPTPNPQPGPAPTPPDDGYTPRPPDEDSPAWWDIGGQVRKAITDFFRDLVEDALNPVLQTMGETVLATPDLTGHATVRSVWTANLVIANAIFVLFIVAAGFVVAARETLQTQYGLKELAPRVVIAGLAANLSLLLVGQAIDFVNALTAGVAGQGVDPETAAQALTDAGFAVSGANFLGLLLMLAAIVMAIIIVVTFIIRVAVLVVLIDVAPLALLFHALPQTEQLAFTWWKAVAGCFAIQLGQTVVLVAAIRIFLTPVGPIVLGFPSSGSGWLGLLVALAMMWLLVKVPMWVKDYLWLHSRGVLRRVIFAILMLRTVSLAAAGRGGRRPSPTRPSGPGSPRPRPGPGPGPRPGPRPRPTGPRPAAPRPTAGTRPRPAPAPRPGTGPGPRATAGSRRRPAPAAGPSVAGGPGGGSTGGRSPAATAVFSHTGRPHRPMPTPAAAGADPVFSHAQAPHRPAPPPDGPAAPVFSRPPQPHVPGTDPLGQAPPVRFSHAPTPATPYPGPMLTAEPVRFSHAPRPATASLATSAGRPPAVPARSVFSDPATARAGVRRSTPASTPAESRAASTPRPAPRSGTRTATSDTPTRAVPPATMPRRSPPPAAVPRPVSRSRPPTSRESIAGEERR